MVNKLKKYYFSMNLETKKPSKSPQNGAPILNKLNSDNVTKNVNNALNAYLLLKESTNDCCKTFKSASPPRVIINSLGNSWSKFKTKGEYRPNIMHKSENNIAEIYWFWVFGLLVNIPVTGPVKQVDTAPK